MPETEVKKDEKKATEPEKEDRVDETAINMFTHLGFIGTAEGSAKRLPNRLVEIYLDFKRVKDRLRPGPLTAEGFAFVVTLYSLWQKGK